MKPKMGQQSHRSDTRILNRRTLQRDHRHLASLLHAGMDVLDVGCGTGAITADIARAVGPDGMALGIDRDEANVAGAARQYAGLENLDFQTADILALDEEFHNRFDIVTAARTIQWISEPQTAIRNMKNPAQSVGPVTVLASNLAQPPSDPPPPI